MIENTKYKVGDILYVAHKSNIQKGQIIDVRLKKGIIKYYIKFLTYTRKLRKNDHEYHVAISEKYAFTSLQELKNFVNGLEEEDIK